MSNIVNFSYTKEAIKYKRNTYEKSALSDFIFLFS